MRRALALALSAVAVPGIASAARTDRDPIRVLVAATVSDRARGIMPSALWTRYVTDFAGPGSGVLDAEDPPDLTGCRKAGGDFLILAPFDLRDQLPGMPNAGGRFAGRADLALIDCNVGATVFARIVRFDGEPVSARVAGTTDAIESAWSHVVPQTLAQAGPAAARITRIRMTDSGGGIVILTFAFGAAIRAETLEDAVGPRRSSRRPPLRLTVTRTMPTGAEAIFAAPATPNADLPAIGDIVERVL